jgi:hypothetical protein
MITRGCLSMTELARCQQSAILRLSLLIFDLSLRFDLSSWSNNDEIKPTARSPCQ